LRRLQLVAIVLVAAVVVGGVALFASGFSLSSSKKVNLLANGGFETGDLSGWDKGNPLVPTVESTVVYNNTTHAVRFETTANGNVLGECTQQGLQCSAMNSSTISQTVNGFSLTPNSSVSIALNPMFASPSTFQMTLEFAPVSLGSPDIIIYYVFSASSQECGAYSQLLVNGSNYARAFCLSAQPGGWTVVTRSLLSDIPTSLKPSDFGSSLTLSLSFAGGNSTDAIYVDAVSLRQ